MDEVSNQDHDQKRELAHNMNPLADLVQEALEKQHTKSSMAKYLPYDILEQTNKPIYKYSSSGETYRG